MIRKSMKKGLVFGLFFSFALVAILLGSFNFVAASTCITPAYAQYNPAFQCCGVPGCECLNCNNNPRTPCAPGKANDDCYGDCTIPLPGETACSGSQPSGCDFKFPGPCQDNGCQWTPTTASCPAYNGKCDPGCVGYIGSYGCYIATWSTGGYCSAKSYSAPTVTYYTYYRDVDGDGFGNLAATTSATSQPAGYVSNSNDCNDSNSTIHPGVTEVCNGVDDDCDGQIDEGLDFDADSDGYNSLSSCHNAADCNDNNVAVHPNAAELCNGIDDNCVNGIDENNGNCSGQLPFCLNGVCVQCLNNPQCDDGLWCNGAELCSLTNTCQLGTPPNTNDGIACTLDSCNEATDTITHTPVDSLCQDGRWCNGAEICDTLLGCQTRAFINCDDYITCTGDTCSERADLTDNVGECLHNTGSCECLVNADCNDFNLCTNDFCNANLECDTVNNNTNTCDDGAFCTINDACSAGSCTGNLRPVDDAISCTLDSCDETNNQVLNTPNNALCDDNLYCNGAETCDAVLDCQLGVAPNIDDSIPCTIDNCDEATDTITNTADNSLCQDGLWCNGNEICSTIFGCQLGTSPSVDDSIICTLDSCDEGANITDDLGAPYHNTSACACTVDSDCDDGNSCTDDTCSATYECVNTNNDANTCDDLTFCTINDACSAGACISDPRIVDDSISCTLDSCDEASDQVLHLPSNALCDNSLYCDGAETCDAALGCQSGIAPTIDDSISCTIDNCDELTDSITHTSDNSLCQDGLWCNGNEICSTIFGCQLGTSPSVDDSIVCTQDSCDEGANITDNIGVPSHNTSACACTVDSDCDDSNPCTDDTCNATYECENTNNDLNTCDDLAFCTINDACSAGACISDPRIVDDSISCTLDSCDEVSDQVLHITDNSLCQDGLWCNGAETCDATLGCQSGISPDCSDLLVCSVDTCDEGIDVTDNNGVCLHNTAPCCIDNDVDGYGSSGEAYCLYTNATDCDDTNLLVYPGAPENCTNGIDDNCNNRNDSYDLECNQPPNVADISFNITQAKSGETVRIYCNASDPNGDAITVHLWLADVESTPWNRIDDAVMSFDGSSYYYDWVVANDPVGQAYKVHCSATDGYLLGARREDPAGFTIINSNPNALSLTARWYNHTYIIEGDSSDINQPESSLINNLSLWNSTQVLLDNSTMIWDSTLNNHILSVSFAPGTYDYLYNIIDSNGGIVYISGFITLLATSLCGQGETLCLDGTCSADCSTTDTAPSSCNGIANGICEIGEGCACSDCEGYETPCQSGFICQAGVCTALQQPPCPSGLTLCSDGFCRANCISYNCTLNGICEAGEGCQCSDCNMSQDSCQNTLVCLNNVCTTPDWPPCDLGNTLCSNGICLPSCNGLFNCNNNSICDANEGCECADCLAQQDNCSANLVCNNSICSTAINPPCPVGTSLCSSGVCLSDCGIFYNCNNNTVCDAGEGCECADCFTQNDNCSNNSVCVNSVCTQAQTPLCPAGTTLCSSGVCLPSCGIYYNCTIDGLCSPGESCQCADCEDRTDTCSGGLTCMNGTCNSAVIPPCPNGYTLCSDSICRIDCVSLINCNNNSICDAGEGCECSDCYTKQDSCSAGTCDPYSQTCSNLTEPSYRNETLCLTNREVNGSNMFAFASANYLFQSPRINIDSIVPCEGPLPIIVNITFIPGSRNIYWYSANVTNSHVMFSISITPKPGNDIGIAIETPNQVQATFNMTGAGNAESVSIYRTNESIYFPGGTWAGVWKIGVAALNIIN